MNRTTLKILSCLVVALTAGAAFAEDDAELVEKVAVRNRLFSVAQRWEFGGNFGFTLLPRLTEHYNLNLSVAYNVADWLAFELRGGYAISRHTSLADQIQTDFASNTSISKANDLSDLWEMTGNAVIGARFQPIYGKVNLLAELPVHFQFYLWAGGGVGLLKRESVLICTARTSATECGDYYRQNRVSPLVSLAIGFRFFIAEHHAVKIEARDYSFLDSYYENVDRATATVDNPTPGGQPSPNAGITNLVQIDLGYSFIF